MVPFHRSWSIPEAIQIACVMEAAAPKLGNVHPGAGFRDMRFEHFVASASAIPEVFRDANLTTVGSRILESTRQMRSVCGTNTHLGTILLLAPLADAIKRCREKSSTSLSDLKRETQTTLDALSAQDSADVYAAIHLTQPGGLGSNAQADVSQQAPESLVEAMRLAPKHDSVAQEYTCNFANVLDTVLPSLNAHLSSSANPLDAIARTQLDWLSTELDGLIVRKTDEQTAENIRSRAATVRNQCTTTQAALADQPQWQRLDALMRSDGNRLNPGTTADLIAAALFVRLSGFTS